MFCLQCACALSLNEMPLAFIFRKRNDIDAFLRVALVLARLLYIRSEWRAEGGDVL